MRYFFEISYNGSAYSGWQSQFNATGIQTVVEESMSKLFRESIAITASGRTDAGVHCEQQFFHCDITNEFNLIDYRHRLNSFLPKYIAIKSISKVTDTANARYDALERSYRYDITTEKNPLLDGLAWHFFKQVNVETMNDAAALLVGKQDFESFSKVKTDVNHFVCDIMRAKWERSGNRLHFHITANRFLRGMVRAVVGTLLDVGTGKISMKEFESIIRSRDRKKAGANVPAYGLYLTGVKYPESIFIK